MAAAECVSRSDSLLRHVRTRCLNSRADAWLLEECFASAIVKCRRDSKVCYGVGGGVSGFSGNIAGV